MQKKFCFSFSEPILQSIRVRTGLKNHLGPAHLSCSPTQELITHEHTWLREKLLKGGNALM